MPLFEIQRTRAQSAYGSPVIQGSWRVTVSAGCATFVSLNTSVASSKLREVASWNW